jgi:hypothetical protein
MTDSFATLTLGLSEQKQMSLVRPDGIIASIIIVITSGSWRRDLTSIG